MYCLHVSYADRDERAEPPLVLEREPGLFEREPGLWGLDTTLVTPSGEPMRLNAALAEGNRSVTFNVWIGGGEQSLQVGGFFLPDKAFSPSISVRTPRGRSVRLLIGPPARRG